jgi:hypothetical protein
MLATLAAGCGGTFAVFGEVAAAAAMTALLTAVAVLGLLLLPIAIVVLVALLARLDVLVVGSALIGHFLLLCVAPRVKVTNEGPRRSLTYYNVMPARRRER